MLDELSDADALRCQLCVLCLQFGNPSLRGQELLLLGLCLICNKCKPFKKNSGTPVFCDKALYVRESPITLRINQIFLCEVFCARERWNA